MSEINVTVQQPPNYSVTVNPDSPANVSVLLASPANIDFTTPGPQGVGVPSGGTANQALTKVNSDNFNTQWTTVDKTFIGLSNVDNTSDINKPVSTATQVQLNLKHNLPITEIFILNAGDITNKFITLSSSPQVAESVTLIPEGGIFQINGDDFDVVGSILSWNGLGLDGFLEAGDKIVVTY